MEEGIEESAKTIAGLVLGMPEETAIRTLANMEYFVRALVLHVMERDGSAAKAETFRAKIVQRAAERKGAVQ